jgi:basic membrane protein A
MSKRLFWTISTVAVLSLLTATGAALAQSRAGASPSAQGEVAPAPAAQASEKYGLIAGNVKDGGFNQLAWEGMQRAAEELGVEVQHLETAADTAESNIAQFVDEGYNGIVTVGVEMAGPTQAASEANPDIPFVSVDVPSQAEGDLGLLFDVDAPSFMAGYLAAGMTQSGTVCTFGGVQIPPVLAFLVGFESGIRYYNQQHDADVALLGWTTDPSSVVAGEGIFADTFTDSQAGADIAAGLFDQGCDIIFPVAGATGLGAAQLAHEQGLTVIGVDADQTQTEPELADAYLTSAMKQIDVAVFEAVKLIHEGNSQPGENYIGTLENGGVGLAPFHSFEDAVPQGLKDDLAEIEQGLIDGSISTGWPIYKIPNVRHLTPDMLGNLSYPSEYTAGGVAPLADGKYEEAAAPGSAAMTTIQLSDMVAFGDLDADGVDDAAVVLISDTSGTGRFYDVVAVLDRNGKAFPVASAFLGDRIEINAVTIEDGQIVVDMLTRGPDAAMADAPTQPETRTYKIQVSLEQVVEPVTATQVIEYMPEVPGETQAGSCFTSASGLQREDAYRCMTEDDEIFDPCFAVDDEPTVVCGANPATGAAGFVLELTEPLPEPDLGALSQPWLVELEDGTICGLSTGTAPVVDDVRADYACDDSTNLLGELQQGEIWMAEKAVIDLGDDGFSLVESEMVPIRTVWQ